MRKLNETFIIRGPEDHNLLDTYWVMDFGWGSMDTATRFDKRILTLPLPSQARGVLDLATMNFYAPFPSGRGTIEKRSF